MMVITLQNEIESIRQTMHKVIHALLANSTCRETSLSYLAALLRHNDKRTQIQTEESTLAGDGFALNLLSVFQLLSVKIKLDTVDPLYPFHPKSLIDIKNETRLKLSSQEVDQFFLFIPSVFMFINLLIINETSCKYPIKVTEWVEDLESKGHTWSKVKFSTQCWFLTLHCHHIALIPALQKHQNRLRALRDLQKMLDELQATESQWKDTVHAPRNEELIKRWKQQLKRMTRAKACADAGLIDPAMLRRSLSFYTSVAEVLLKQLTGVENVFELAYDNNLANILNCRSETPKAFTALPEWYIEDIAEFLLFSLT